MTPARINPENYSAINLLKNVFTRNLLSHFSVIFLGLLLYDLGGVDMHSLLKKSALVFLLCIGPLNLLFCFPLTRRAAYYCSSGVAMIFSRCGRQLFFTIALRSIAKHDDCLAIAV